MNLGVCFVLVSLMGVGDSELTTYRSCIASAFDRAEAVASDGPQRHTLDAADLRHISEVQEKARSCLAASFASAMNSISRGQPEYRALRLHHAKSVAAFDALVPFGLEGAGAYRERMVRERAALQDLFARLFDAARAEAEEPMSGFGR